MRCLIRTLGLALLLLGLTACGFHLRGNYSFPTVITKGTYVDSPTNDPEFLRALKRGLANAGVNLVDDPAQASATLRILEDRQARQTTSVNAQGRPREYELYQRVRFRVDTPQGVLLPEQEFTLHQIQGFNEGEILAANQEAQFLFDDMARNAADRVLRQLGSLGPEAQVKQDADAPSE